MSVGEVVVAGVVVFSKSFLEILFGVKRINAVARTIIPKANAKIVIIVDFFILFLHFSKNK
jgi:hypothetical protein